MSRKSVSKVAGSTVGPIESNVVGYLQKIYIGEQAFNRIASLGARYNRLQNRGAAPFARSYGLMDCSNPMHLKTFMLQSRA